MEEDARSYCRKVEISYCACGIGCMPFGAQLFEFCSAIPKINIQVIKLFLKISSIANSSVDVQAEQCRQYFNTEAQILHFSKTS